MMDEGSPLPLKILGASISDHDSGLQTSLAEIILSRQRDPRDFEDDVRDQGESEATAFAVVHC
jgi:hypothetical protein